MMYFRGYRGGYSIHHDSDIAGTVGRVTVLRRGVNAEWRHEFRSVHVQSGEFALDGLILWRSDVSVVRLLFPRIWCYTVRHIYQSSVVESATYINRTRKSRYATCRSSIITAITFGTGLKKIIIYGYPRTHRTRVSVPRVRPPWSVSLLHFAGTTNIKTPTFNLSRTFRNFVLDQSIDLSGLAVNWKIKEILPNKF